MTWPRWIREKARQFVVACTGPDWPGRAAQAQRLLEDLPEEDLLGGATVRAPAAPTGRIDKSALPFAPKVGPTQRERKAERNDRMLQLRLAVLARARGRCEFRCPLGGEPVDAHNVFGGADRRELEGPFTLAAVCETCHGRCNESPAWARDQALMWARRMAGEAHLVGDVASATGFRGTAEMLERRIALAAAQAPRSEP